MSGLQSETNRGISLPENGRDYALFVMDVDHRIAGWSRGAEWMLGYTDEEIVGSDFLRLIPEDTARESFAEFLGAPPGERRRMELECWCLRKGKDRFRAVVGLDRMTGASGAQSGISVMVRDLSDRNRVEEQLRENELQLRSLAARLQAVREEERTRIARELHDEFGQMLTALRMDLSILERMVWKTVSEPLARMSLFEKIGSISELLEKTIRSTRRIITELRPAVLDELGLSTAIQWQALEFENRTGVRCRIARLQHDLVFDQDVSTAIFRILQEALTNVAKHASATNVTISLRSEGGTVVMEIVDDGKGMAEDKQKDPTSTGILGIRERVLALNGQFDITSSQGQGTTLKISIPYHPVAGGRA